VVVSPLLVRGSPSGLCARTSPLDASAVLTHPALGRTGLVPIAEVEAGEDARGGDALLR
jgi:hypothetical protein